MRSYQLWQCIVTPSARCAVVPFGLDTGILIMPESAACLQSPASICFLSPCKTAEFSVMFADMRNGTRRWDKAQHSPYFTMHNGTASHQVRFHNAFCRACQALE